MKTGILIVIVTGILGCGKSTKSNEPSTEGHDPSSSAKESSQAENAKAQFQRMKRVSIWDAQIRTADKPSGNLDLAQDPNNPGAWHSVTPLKFAENPIDHLGFSFDFGTLSLGSVKRISTNLHYEDRAKKELSIPSVKPHLPNADFPSRFEIVLQQLVHIFRDNFQAKKGVIEITLWNETGESFSIFIEIHITAQSPAAFNSTSSLSNRQSSMLSVIPRLLKC